jgi:transcriptional regulator with XRE-family HTH domain
LDAGKRLRVLREQLGLTVRDVSAYSAQIAGKSGNRAYLLPLSRLFEIENKNVVPSAYRFYTLAVIYRRDIRVLMNWYGIDINQAPIDSAAVEIPNSHISDVAEFAGAAAMPITLVPSFDPVRTMNLGTMVQEWGLVPFSYLSQFKTPKYSYGYIGNSDFTMYPILPPGCFVQIDESKDKIVRDGAWRSEYDRPIYFLETREGCRCCWCSLQNGYLTLQPHPLSREPVRSFRYPQDVEIIGQVVGVAMKLQDRSPSYSDKTR